MSAFTLGPWVVREGRNGHPEAIDTKEYGIAVCRMQEWDNPEWQQANARLIAAAPELYEALRVLVGAADVRCRCTLAEIDSGHHVDCPAPRIREAADVARAVLAKAAQP